MTPDEVRRLFPIVERRTYLFSGGLSPASRPARAAVQRFTDLWTHDVADLYQRIFEEHELIRGRFAELIGADTDEVAITDGTSSGSNLAVELIEPRPGANVVVDEFGFKSSIHPWLLPARAGVELRFVQPRDGRILLEDVARAVDERTIAISVSHVSHGEGFRHDLAGLARLARASGALLLVDAAQSAGVVAIDVHALGVDFLSCGASKWLLGAAGVGFLYVARRHLDRLPPHAGWASGWDEPGRHDLHVFRPKPGAARFQLGLPNLIGLAATRPGLEILIAVGIERVERHVADLVGYCIAALQQRGLSVLTPAEAEHRAGVIALELPDYHQAQRFLRQRGIDVGDHAYNRTLRIDPHIFNHRGDIDRFLAGLDEYLAQRR